MAACEPPIPDLLVSERSHPRSEKVRVTRACRLTVAMLIGLTPAVLFINVWRVGGVSALGDDLIYYLPVRAYVGERLKSAELPLWNPYVSMGTPVAADPQAGVWYP